MASSSEHLPEVLAFGWLGNIIDWTLDWVIYAWGMPLGYVRMDVFGINQQEQRQGHGGVLSQWKEVAKP